MRRLAVGGVAAAVAAAAAAAAVMTGPSPEERPRRADPVPDCEYVQEQCATGSPGAFEYPAECAAALEQCGGGPDR